MMNNLAFTLHDKGELDQAEAMYREVIEMQRSLVGDTHPDVALALNNLSTVQRDQGRLDAAIQSSQESLDIYRRIHDSDHPDVARGLSNLALLEMEKGDLETAEERLREALAMREGLLDAGHPDIAKSQVALARALNSLEQFDEARRLAAGARATFLANLGEDHWRTAVATATEGAAEAGLGNFGNAEKLLLASYTVLDADPAVRRVYVDETLRSLAALYRAWGKDEEADRYAALLERP
jgi:tetratricopeptide (TPR) repeat protein